MLQDPQLHRQGEGHVFFHQLALVDGAVEAGDQLVDHAAYQVVGGRGAGGHQHGVDVFKPLVLQLALVVEQVGGGAVVFAELFEPHAVAAVDAADHQGEVGAGGQLAHGVLAVGGGVADVFFGRRVAPGEAFFDGADDDVGVVDTERGLGEVGQRLGLGEVELRDVGGALDDVHDLGGFAVGAFDLLVVFVAHQQDLVAHLGVAPGLDVHLGDQRAGGVDHAQVALGGLGPHLGADAVGAKDDRGAAGDRRDRLDEGDALAHEALHDVLVVHDGVVDVERRADEVDKLLHGVDGHVHAGAEAAGTGEDDLHTVSLGHGCGPRERRKRQATSPRPRWIPACAGMTRSTRCAKTTLPTRGTPNARPKLGPTPPSFPRRRESSASPVPAAPATSHMVLQRACQGLAVSC